MTTHREITTSFSESEIAAMEARIVEAAIEMLQHYGDPRDNSMKMAKRRLESLLEVEAGA